MLQAVHLTKLRVPERSTAVAIKRQIVHNASELSDIAVEQFTRR